MNPDTDLPLIEDELSLLDQLCPLAAHQLVELGCGAARLARNLLSAHPDCRLLGLEVDERQHAKNLAAPPTPGLSFALAGAERIPLPDQAVDGVLMLKSLHHVPMDRMDQALAEVHRVLRPGGWLYVSEPIYAGALNELVRLYNDEGTVRAAAQAALDRALASPAWQPRHEHRFATAVRFADFDDFEQRMMRPTYADHRLSDERVAQVRAAYTPHQGPQGASFVRPMHVRVLGRV